MDDPRIKIHESVLAKKPMLQQVFREYHEIFWSLDKKYFYADKKLARIELGSGIAPMKMSYPIVLATDVVHSETVDQVVDAHEMPFEDSSVRALYAKSCFHHLSDPAKFLRQCERVLAPGGGLIMIEPYYSPLAKIVYPRLHKTETYDQKMEGWQAPITSAMEGANQALCYIVFKRDRSLFEQQFPGLEIVKTIPLTNYPRLVLSGGLNFNQLITNRMIPVVKILEFFLKPFAPILSLNHALVIRRR